MIYSQEEIISHFLEILKKEGRVYAKKTLTIAKKAQLGTQVITETSDGQRIEASAKPGDWLVENQSEKREQYLMSAAIFNKKYSLQQAIGNGWAAYRSLIPVYGLKLTAKDLTHFGNTRQLEFYGPREKSILLHPGDYLIIPTDQSEVYRVTAKEFEETYKPVKASE